MNAFAGDTESGMERTLGKFAEATELSGVVDTLEGRDPPGGSATGWRGELV